MAGSAVQAIIRAGINEAKFWARVRRTTGCWFWTGRKHQKGYGVWDLRRYPVRIRVPAHRVAFTLLVGPIPDGTCVLHRCDTPPCVRPDHLFLGSRADNNRDRHEKGRDAVGDRSGARRHPEKWKRGDEHWTRRYPERLLGAANPNYRHGRYCL